MNSDIDQIKEKLNIEDIVSEYIKIKKAGSSYTALCPFHSEKSPSFHISPDRGIFKCFGCGESGDIFSFVEKFENLSFPDVKKRLAEKAGVQIENFSPQNKKSKEEIDKKKEKEKKLLEILEEATNFFAKNLFQNSNAKNYLKKRGIDEKIAKKFRLGFAPDKWNDLENFLLKKNFSKEEILEVGLSKKNEQGKIYDRFRNRILFPIFDESGKTVAFSGRDFSGKENTAKYLNSPQTLFFDKSNILFGLNFAKAEARKRKYFILVEGQMDLVMSHKAGFENTVATSGTSLTENQLKKMSGFSKNLIFAFDSDKAGVEAAFRGIQKALSMDFDIKILDIPAQKDPADIILESEKKWKDVVKNSKNVIDFYIKKIITSQDNLKEKIKQMEEKILPFLAEISNPIEKGKYISKISSGFEVDSEFVQEAIERAKEKKIIQEKKEIETKYIQKKVDIFPEHNIIEKSKKIILKELAAIYFWQKNLNKIEPIVECEEVLKIIEKFSEKEDFEKILNLEKKNQEYIQNLIFYIETLYSQKDKEKIKIDIESLETRLKKIDIEKKIEVAKKENDLKSLIYLSRKKDGY